MAVHNEQEEARSSGTAAFMGLGIAVVWLAIVAGIAYSLAAH